MITLTKALEVGVAKIDMQHRELVDRLNDVMAMGGKSVTKEETAKTLDLLGEYVVRHFGDEEALQKKSNYPKYDWHKEQHQGFIKEFKELKKEFAANGQSTKFTMDLNKTMVNWIVRHIKSADAELGKHLRSQGMT